MGAEQVFLQVLLNVLASPMLYEERCFTDPISKGVSPTRGVLSVRLPGVSSMGAEQVFLQVLLHLLAGPMLDEEVGLRAQCFI
ncbi:hypothetical protein M8J75_007019 [Diaphorina citri]|nr:hypothetical protein M8J75_007019 [Diaphorina citri]